MPLKSVAVLSILAASALPSGEVPSVQAVANSENASKRAIGVPGALCGRTNLLNIRFMAVDTPS
jgi:hypothetical protein